MKSTKAIIRKMTAVLLAGTLALTGIAGGFGATALTPSKAEAANGTWQYNGQWWYDRGDGTYAQNCWENIGGSWYLFDFAGYMCTGWVSVGGTWYYLASSGAMTTGWQSVNGAWYYMDASGAMMTGWINYRGAWYYLGGSGAMLTNSWISGVYWVGADGVMATSSWVDGGKYWVDTNGRYVANNTQGSGAGKLANPIYASGSTVYHIYNCRSAVKIKNPIKTTVAQAEAKGLTLCKNCESMSH